MRYFYFFIFFVLINFCSCTKDWYFNNPQEYVIEGWIEAGGSPVVIITKTLPISSDHTDLSDMSKYVEIYAKVTIWDDKDTAIFMGKTDKNYDAQFIYTTSRVIGKLGKTYHLKVEIDDFVATATTTIPNQKAVADSIIVFDVDDKRKGINVKVSPQDGKYFGFFEKVKNQESYYRKTFWGLFSYKELSDNSYFEVNKDKFQIQEEFDQYFKQSDTVFVKFASMDSISYQFWDGYFKMSNLVRNPLFPYQDNLQGNINGALGYFCGYASQLYIVE